MCVGVQGRWRFLLNCYGYILAAFSLRMVRNVRWHLTAFLLGRHGTDSPVVVWWACVLLLHAGMWLVFKEPEGIHSRAAFQSVLKTFTPNVIMADGPCAASYKSLLATQRWLLCMTTAGSALLGLCWFVYPYYHDLLNDEADRLRQSASSRKEAAVPLRRFARGQKVMVASYAIGIMAMLGMNLLRPVIPGVLLSGALFDYRCNGTHAAWTNLILAGLSAFVCYQAFVLFEFFAGSNVHREWQDREWERTTSGSNS